MFISLQYLLGPRYIRREEAFARGRTIHVEICYSEFRKVLAAWNDVRQEDHIFYATATRIDRNIFLCGQLLLMRCLTTNNL